MTDSEKDLNPSGKKERRDIMQNYLKQIIRLSWIQRSRALLFSIVLAIFCVLSVNACTTITMGKNFSGPGVTEGIEVGKTKMETVMATLGEPRGRGKGHLPAQGPVDVWEYYYAVASVGADAKQKLLMIFFDKERVVRGYIWWSQF